MRWTGAWLSRGTVFALAVGAALAVLRAVAWFPGPAVLTLAVRSALAVLRTVARFTRRAVLTLAVRSAVAFRRIWRGLHIISQRKGTTKQQEAQRNHDQNNFLDHSSSLLMGQIFKRLSIT